MTKNLVRFYISAAAVLAAFCVIAFVVPFAKTAVFWLSLVFGVIAIVVQLYTMPRAMAGDTRSKFYGFPTLRISFIYLAAQLILSLLFMALAAIAPVWIPTVLYLVLLCAALIGFVGADSVREEVVKQDANTKKQVSVMRAFQSQVENLSINCDASIKPELDKSLAKLFVRELRRDKGRGGRASLLHRRAPTRCIGEPQRGYPRALPQNEPCSRRAKPAVQAEQMSKTAGRYRPAVNAVLRYRRHIEET